jgi:hypothetical protein
MLANRQGIKDNMEKNPILIDAYIFDLKCKSEGKKVTATITLTANTTDEVYSEYDIGSIFDYTIFQKIIGDDYTAHIWGMKSKKNIADLQDTLEDLQLVEIIEKDINGKNYTQLPDDKVCIDHITLAELLYYNRNGRNNERLMSYKYVKFDEEDDNFK